MNSYYNPNIRILETQLRNPLVRWHFQTQVSFWRIYWNAVPGAYISFQGESFELNPDRIILVAPRTLITQSKSDPPVSHFYVHFRAANPFDFIGPHVYALLVTPMEAPLLEFLHAKMDPSGKENAATDIELNLNVRSLIHLALRRVPDCDFRDVPPYSETFSRSLAYIDAHLDRPISNAELASHFGMSVNSMLRRYQKIIHMSPQTYIRMRRIERACMLLRDPNLLIKEVADATGFSNQYQFSSVFAAVEGIPPSEYRRKCIGSTWGDSPRN